MTIFVSEELPYIKDELEKRGYEVTSDHNISCNVIICDLKNKGLIDSNLENSVKPEGTLIIDSGRKSIDDIEKIIFNRVYSALY
ncbi:YkuS family protein [Haloimpatiens sp. FM7315]|uniref:YkuS family protein n=1 Tax=Haloimpatiens sp. FM7315 TaxID=3298609 RepID=UPI0035A34204